MVFSFGSEELKLDKWKSKTGVSHLEFLGRIGPAMGHNVVVVRLNY